MPKIIYVQFLSEQPNANLHYLNRLVEILNHFILIEPEDKPRGSECNNKRLANGTHPSQIKKICPHCGKEIDIGNYKRWHRK